MGHYKREFTGDEGKQFTSPKHIERMPEKPLPSIAPFNDNKESTPTIQRTEKGIVFSGLHAPDGNIPVDQAEDDISPEGIDTSAKLWKSDNRRKR